MGGIQILKNPDWGKRPERTERSDEILGGINPFMVTCKDIPQGSASAGDDKGESSSPAPATGFIDQRFGQIV